MLELSNLVRRALGQSIVPLEFRFSPDLLRKYDKVLAENYLPPRDKVHPKPFLRLKDAPSVAFCADRSLKPGTVVLLTNRRMEGTTIDVTQLQIPGFGGSVTVNTPPPKPSLWSSIKERTRSLFK